MFNLNSCARAVERVVGAPLFGQITIALIVINAIVMGCETSVYLYSRFSSQMEHINTVIQLLFVLEMTLRIFSFFPKPWAFFKDGWNVFDFAIVLFSLLPVSGPYATVARIARVLRIGRLISASDELRLIIGTMLKSLPSMGHVSILLSSLLYIYGIIGFHLFHSHDPENWGNIARAMITLFEILTLEGWVEIQDKALEVNPYSWIFFKSFVVIAVFVVVNLFIAVVINNLDTVKKEMPKYKADEKNFDAARKIREIQSKLNELEAHFKNGS